MSEFINTIDTYGDNVVFEWLVYRTITEFKDSVLTSVGGMAFNSCTSLTEIDIPNVASVGYNAFQGCTALSIINIPNVTSIGSYAFNECTSLTEIDLPKVTSVGYYAFYDCTSLKTLILRSETLCTLSNTNALNKTLIANGTGYIYVPTSLYNSYRSATNWSTYSARFRKLESYTIDGTITGALNPIKI